MSTTTLPGRIPPARVRRLVGHAFASVVALSLLSACGDATGEQSAPSADPSSASAAPAADPTSPCGEAARTVEYAERVDPQATMTSASLGADLAEASRFFAGTEPPSELTEEWTIVGDLLATLAEAFEGVDRPTDQQVQDAAATLGADIAARTEAAMTAAKSITAYLRAECDLEVAATDDPCALLSNGDLHRVFGSHPVPEPRPRSLGAGFAGCDWEIDQDDMSADDFAVHVTLMPVEAFRSDYLSRMRPTGDAPGLGDGHTFDGSVTLGGGSTRGHSVSFSAGETGGFVSVQKGNAGAAKTEIALATGFATSVRRQLR